MNQLVSIIIPTYQTETYIKRAVESAYNQTYPNVEIVVIDDGSTDKTKEILTPYIEKQQIHYVFKENGGLSDARNVGITHASGAYIYFLDSDDWIETTYIEKMMQHAQKNDADIVLSSIIMTDGSKEDFRSDTFLKNITDENVRNFYTPIHFHPIMQNKLFKSSLIKENKLTFPIGLYYEDVYFFVKAFEMSAVVVRCPEARFYYFQHPGSIMKQTSKKLLDIEKIFSLLLAENAQLKSETWFEYLCIRHLFLASTRRAICSKDKQLLKLVIQSHLQFIEQYFPNWQRNPFLKQKELYDSFGQYAYAKTIRVFGYKRGCMIAKCIV